MFSAEETSSVVPLTTATWRSDVELAAALADVVMATALTAVVQPELRAAASSGTDGPDGVTEMAPTFGAYGATYGGVCGSLVGAGKMWCGGSGGTLTSL